jgi:hypothetical protein
MDNLERHLREAPLAKPSAAHDAAMQRIFTEAQLRRPPLWSANIALWKSAAACALCLSFGYLLHAYVEPPKSQSQPEPLVYVIPPDPALRGAFEAVKVPAPTVLDPQKLRVGILPAAEQDEKAS